ncbi:MAG: nucleotidyl transferase AbiEii/AbiGii toxin family protein [Deltaproteobacteria bacterium]|nr:nucleotidyl transferase AbiEii/AbiGii toxin family protein [Deltaproteobacteria bacterium]
MTLETTTHRNILIQILKDIYTDFMIGPFLGFKGGTAAYLFYGLGRFSVDLDFDLLDPHKTDIVFERVREILKTYGKIKEAEQKRFNLFYMLSYTHKVEGAQNVKVEINRRDFKSRFEVKPYLGISMKVMIREDMFAHKLVAMFERIGHTNRDIFDVWFFLKNNWPINKEIVERRVGMPFKDFLKKCIDALEKIGDRRILAGMGELLDEKQKAWAKMNLRKDTIFLLRMVLKP